MAMKKNFSWSEYFSCYAIIIISVMQMVPRIIQNFSEKTISFKFAFIVALWSIALLVTFVGTIRDVIDWRKKTVT